MKTYFLGGSSPSGFSPAFEDVVADTDHHTYIIKGGPGTGKSSLMKKLLAEFEDSENELYLCSSDPDSADMVRLKKQKVNFVDGTAPHVCDPEYPGAVQEIINMGDCWDSALLQSQKDELIAADSEYRQYHLRCRKCLCAAAAVLADTRAIADSALNRPKLDGFVKRLAKKLLPQKPQDGGKLVYRRISAVTPKGYLTLLPEGDKIYLLGDEFYSGSEYFLRSFAELAVKKGLTAEVSVCTVHADEFFEHLRIPELAISFISSNPLNKTAPEENTFVNFSRFYDKQALYTRKNRLKFNKNAANELVEEAVTALKNAKAAHDKLETFYINATDFSKAEKIFITLRDKLRNK
ncbi:MAG: ATPase [Oscillospiraceae bacterium]